MQKRFIATIVDYGETCDGKARVFGIYKTRNEAVKNVIEDIKRFAKKYKKYNVKVDYVKMSVSISNYDYDCGCEWNIEEVEID